MFMHAEYVFTNAIFLFYFIENIQAPLLTDCDPIQSRDPYSSYDYRDIPSFRSGLHNEDGLLAKSAFPAGTLSMSAYGKSPQQQPGKI
jgi:hypothetical protein